MSSYTMFFLLTLSFLVCAVYTEEWRYIGDDNSDNSSITEEKNPLTLKLTTLLDIKVNGKSEIFQTNLNGLTGLDNVKSFEGNPFKIDGNICNDLDKFRKDVINALRQMNSEITKLKQSNCNVENYNDIEKDNTGFKTSIGVHYERSSIKKQKYFPTKTYPTSCKEISDNKNNVSGIYEIQPILSKKPFAVLCDMDTKGGGWTHVQKRFDGSQDFDLGWRDYKFGFGDFDGEFWLGLENIYKMTVREGTELLVELEDRDGARAYAHYTSFKIGSEKEGYPISALNGFSGDAGDSLTGHLKMKFTTKDFDQDTAPAHNCALLYGGGWWFTQCHPSHLNARYINVDLPSKHQYQGINWEAFRPLLYTLAKSRMLIR